MVCTLMKKHRHHSHRRRNGGGDGGACSRNVETTGAGVSFRPHNIFPDFCMLFLKLPVVIYLVFYCEMQRTSLLIMTTVDILLHCLIRATECHWHLIIDIWGTGGRCGLKVIEAKLSTVLLFPDFLIHFVILITIIIIITRSITVSEMTKTAQALQEIQGKNDWRDGSSNVSWLTTPTWRSAAECSTVGQKRLEKLDRRWLKDWCDGQQTMMLMHSGDADEPRQQMTDGVPQQGTAELSSVGICTPEQPA